MRLLEGFHNYVYDIISIKQYIIFTFGNVLCLKLHTSNTNKKVLPPFVVLPKFIDIFRGWSFNGNLLITYSFLVAGSRCCRGTYSRTHSLPRRGFNGMLWFLSNISLLTSFLHMLYLSQGFLLKHWFDSICRLVMMNI